MTELLLYRPIDPLPLGTLLFFVAILILSLPSYIASLYVYEEIDEPMSREEFIEHTTDPTKIPRYKQISDDTFEVDL